MQTRAEKVLAGVLGAYLLVITAMALFASDMTVANFYSDDAFFYLKTARHIADGTGSTFDGINPTNGYHPLWLLILTAMSAISPLEGSGPLRLLLPVHGLLIAGTVVFLNRLAAALSVSAPWRLAFGCCMLASQGFIDAGMESAVLMLLCSALLAELIGDRPGRGVKIAVLSTLICLARTDASLFMAVVGVAASAEEARRRGLGAGARLLALMGGASLVGFGGFGVFNVIAFDGHFGTVSSTIKTKFPGAFLNPWPLTVNRTMQARLLLVAAVTGPGLLWLGWRAFRGDPAAPERRPAALLCGAFAYAIFHLLLALIMVICCVASWQFALSLTVVWLGVAYFGSHLLASRPGLSRAAAVALSGVMLVGMGLYAKKRTGPGRADRAELCGWLKANLPEDARCYMKDASGYTGYFSDRAVINGDGLINSWEYYDAMVTGDLTDYLSRKEVSCYISDNAPKDGYAEITVHLLERRHTGGVIAVGSAPESAARFGVTNYRVFDADAFEVGALAPTER